MQLILIKANLITVISAVPYVPFQTKYSSRPLPSLDSHSMRGNATLLLK